MHLAYCSPRIGVRGFVGCVWLVFEPWADGEHYNIVQHWARVGVEDGDLDGEELVTLRNLIEIPVVIVEQMAMAAARGAPIRPWPAVSTRGDCMSKN
jgi:hypothetical protein